MIRSLTLLALSLSLSSLPAADWPQFRGPTADGISTAKNLPTSWSSDKNIAWKKEIPGRGWSSPVLSGGKLYLTTALITDGGQESNPKANRSLRALCLDAATGNILWDQEVFKQDGPKAPDTIHSKNGHASPTPIVADGRLYVHFGHQGTACLDLTGKKIWENRSFFYQPRHGNGGSPVLSAGHLIFSCDGTEEQFILALKASDGTRAWKFPRPTHAVKKFAFSTPAVFTIGGKLQVISPGADMVNSLDPATGKEFWRATYEGYSNVPMPAWGDGLVYVSSAFDSPEVLAIDPNGTGDLTATNVKWVETKYAPCSPSMIFHDGLLYMLNDTGFVACREGKSGKLLWVSDRILKGSSASLLLNTSTTGNNLYALDEFGKCAILAAGKEFKLLTTNTLTDEKTLASLAVDDGVIYLRGEKALYCIGEK
jgi:outer membrane protein assembly factor BamB